MSIKKNEFHKEFPNYLKQLHRLTGLPPFAVFRGSLQASLQLRGSTPG